VIDLVAYDDAGCLLTARIALTGSRLTDTLAAGGLIVATGVVIRDMATGRMERRDQAVLDTRALRIALATPPRGSLLHRVAVIPFPATVHVDGYTVHGLLHAPPARHGLRDASQRPWLPLTDAVLEHRPSTLVVRERYDALLVNRSHAHAIVQTDRRTLESRWIAAGDPASLQDPATLRDAARFRGRLGA
jgi:hypothetical protein